MEPCRAWCPLLLLHLLACGLGPACALTPWSGPWDCSGARRLYAWGHNNAGQLGLLDHEQHNAPSLVQLLQPQAFVKTSLGGHDHSDGHTLAVTKDGRLFAAGDNMFGQLGLADLRDRDMFVPLPISHCFKAVAAGGAHSLALSEEGHLYAWGSNEAGQVGSAASKVASEPQQVVMEDEEGGPLQLAGIAAGGRHSLAWTTTGRVYAWGANEAGQLGLGHTAVQKGPQLVKLPEDVQAAQVVAGGSFTLLLSTTGHVYGWGEGLELEPQLLPVISPSLVVALAAGSKHAMLLTQDGQLYGLGDNAAYQLGLGENAAAQVHQPTLVGSPVAFSSVTCGRHHTLAVGLDGGVYGWGLNEEGQLGVGDRLPHAVPKLLPPLHGYKAAFVEAGAVSSMLITAEGDLLGWGKVCLSENGRQAEELHREYMVIVSVMLLQNNAGQLGKKASRHPRVKPELVFSTQANREIAGIAGGGFAYQSEGHSLALLVNGSLQAWGWNAFGQLGLTDGASSTNFPQPIPALLKQRITFAAAGQFASAAVSEAGDVIVWGLNHGGQLGKGDFMASHAERPLLVRLPEPAAQVAVGYSHMLALSRAGRVFAWGTNFYGQLGLGNEKEQSLPKQVALLNAHRVVQVAAGQYHSFALTDKGQLFGWGYNQDFELGLGDSENRVLPQAVTNSSDKKVVLVAAGGYHSLALQEDGSLLSWGLNNYGQLGHGNREPGTRPTLVPLTLNDKALRVRSVAGGSWHSVMADEDGRVWTWGRCQYGQLGTKCDRRDRSQDVLEPTMVRGLDGHFATTVAAGAAHSLACVKPKEDQRTAVV